MKRAVALLAVVVLAGCGTPAPSGSQNLAEGRTFTMSIGTDPGTLDPALTVLSVARSVGRFLYGRLIERTSSGEIVAGLAEKWDATVTTATFTLRQGITCADGAPLTAADVAANITFVGDPKNKSPLAGIQVAPGTSATADEATRTVTVTSGAPDAFLLNNVGTLPIVCAKGLSDRSLLTKGEQGTGMFTISEIVPNDHYTLVRRKDFAWGPGDWEKDQQGLPDKVVVRVIANETTAVNLLLSGQLTAATVAGPDQERLFGQKLDHVDIATPLGTLWFNQAAGHPGQDPAVRRALVQALDLAQVGKVLTNGKGRPSKSLVTVEPRPCTGDNVTSHLPAFDKAAAAAALDTAGWRAGSDGVRSKDGTPLSVKLLQPTVLGPTLTSAAELIQQAWQGIGVKVEIAPVDGAGINQTLFGTGAWDVSMAPVTLSLPSQLVPFASGPVPPQGVNFAHVTNSEFAAASKQAASLTGADGCEHWNRAEAALVRDTSLVPYFDAVVPTFVKGARFTISDSLDPASIRMLAS
ncbi:peptide/nickel transport system substrate-binding protein [Lentzea albidocapillata subsp. violacea]|uniref:Peptide/nickel transport system substrate-binding protein n=1 Tax=Lentzea albidocapillata subsp. violacea TaxID=128104 RepID=A0A1G8QJ17_9PSEU|nr:ABC transporter substrate-binding protein [Lentzea albidocapillata]SDJ04651.1 peptide/nickel transport system substrate-binding protein [Lentzea albidocapillata subsp. violacea]